MIDSWSDFLGLLDIIAKVVLVNRTPTRLGLTTGVESPTGKTMARTTGSTGSPQAGW